jgi:hypothetical protein
MRLRLTSYSLAVLAIFAVCEAALSGPLPNDGYPPEAVHSVALHMHASMSEKFGSMEFHSEKAEALGVDVIWWTEHDWRMSNWRHMKRYDFEATVWNQEKYRWEEPDEDGYPQALRHWTRNTPWKDFLQTEVSDTLA